MSPARRRITVLAAVVAVAVPLTLVVMLRHRIREEWWIHRLDTTEDKQARLEILEEMSRSEHLSERGLDRLTGAARDEIRAVVDGDAANAIPAFSLAIRAGGAKAISAILDSEDENYVIQGLNMLAGEAPLPSGALSGVLPLLAHSSNAVRVEAIAALRDHGPNAEDVVIALSRLLGDPDEDVRAFAEVALSRSALEAEILLRYFTSIAEEPHPGLRSIGIRLLGDLVSSARADGPTSHSAVLAIAGALDDASGEVRQAAAQALFDCRRAIEPVIPALIGAIESSTSESNYLLIDALASIGKPALPRLVTLLEHRSATVRLSAVLALNRMDDSAEAAIPALIERLSDVSPDVRETACKALGDLETKARAAGRALREHLDDGFESIRSEAACALWRVTGDGRAAAAVLRETVSSKNENVFRMSVWTLRDIGPPARAAVPGLRKLLEARKCVHRLWAADALGRILAENAVILERLPAAISCTCDVCPPAATAICRRLRENAAPIIPTCLALLDIPNTSTRTCVARCLAYMGPAAEAAILAFLETAKDSPFAREGAREALIQVRAQRDKN